MRLFWGKGQGQERGAFGRDAGKTVLLLWLLTATSLAPISVVRAAQTLRIVCYNIEADTGGYTTPRPGLYTVLEAIGEGQNSRAAHPVDLVALEETTSNATTVAPVVNALNDYYGAGTYALVAYQGTQRGSATSGNGPNAMIYNTKTVQVVPQNGAQAVGVPGTPTSGSGGAPRQAVRYQFMPVGGGAGSSFYVYVSHMKSSASGLASTNEASRNTEAQLIRADLASLPTDAGVLVMGDVNMEGSFEAAYQTLTAAGTGQVLDPLNFPQDNTQTWNTSAFLPILTESATNLRYRDDIQFMCPAVFNGSLAAGLRYVAGTHRAFGNNGTVPLYGSVNRTGNTALDGLQGPITPSAALAALTTASDHLPIVADYTVGADAPYETWRSRYFTPSDLADPVISGDNADPDGDGIVNLLEYALGLDPRTAGTTGLPAAGITENKQGLYLTLTYTKVLAATDVMYTPQVSGDLVTWISGADAVVAVSATDNAGGLTQTVVVRDATPLMTGNARFMRLLVTRP